MVEFKEVSIEERKKLHAREPYSMEILREFIDANIETAELQMADPSIKGKPILSIVTSLSQAIKRHNFPVKVFQKEGIVYLTRTDMQG